MTDLLNSKQDWEKGSVARTLKNAPERKPEFTTSDGRRRNGMAHAYEGYEVTVRHLLTNREDDRRKT